MCPSSGHALGLSLGFICPDVPTSENCRADSRNGRDLQMMDESALRDVLNVERAATVARIRAMQADLDAIAAASVNTNNDDEHDPEGSTIAYERAQVVALLAAAQSNLGDPDFASARLITGRYSVCERCHAHISSERLAALPAARTCFDCANRAT